MVNVTPALENLDHPLYKIFGDIPAGSSDFTDDSVRHYARPIISLFYILLLCYSVRYNT